MLKRERGEKDRNLLPLDIDRALALENPVGLRETP
jgi:hypothetical protein